MYFIDRPACTNINSKDNVDDILILSKLIILVDNT